MDFRHERNYKYGNLDEFFSIRLIAGIFSRYNAQGLSPDLRDLSFMSIRTCRTSGISPGEDMRRMIIPYVTAICRESFNSFVKACVGHVGARL